MIDISKLNRIYDIRRMDDSDVDSILSFCRKNTQFYEYCEAEPTREQVLGDLHITPPGIGLSDKYYIGFYQNETLIAVMDLIDGYPEPEIAFIGFFMMNKDGPHSPMRKRTGCCFSGRRKRWTCFWSEEPFHRPNMIKASMT